MKKILTLLFLIGAIGSANAQKEFNRWSFEINGGFNKAMSPISPPFLTPTLNVGTLDIGSRYMINERFGLKGIIEGGNFSSLRKQTPSFQTNYLHFGAMGVANLGRIFKFESFTTRFGLLGTLGLGIIRLKYVTTPLPFTKPEYSQVIKSGISGIYKINRKLSLSGRVDLNFNGRQTYTFDGTRYNAPEPTFFPTPPYIHATGTWWTGTLGLNFYLGKHEQHADWYIAPDTYVTKDELESQIGEIKDMLKDSDGDGVPDYLDKEPNTPAGARVNAQGNTLDSDKDGTPDHLDKCPFIPGPSSTDGCPVEEVKNEIDYLKKAINDQYLNVYFSFDSSKPLAYSISSVQFISNFLKRNPELKVEIKGYADELGGENYNLELSEKRAVAVFELLRDSGIDETRLSYKGYGEDTSVDKSSENARQMARRVSFEAHQ
ncbi:OmpA family protein [Algoriphagus sp.]|uniref:OmpA family protein n=1 Tax=Algoriphagus sp. TaxID=1872435 RepID=UPI00260BD647|nr:OmpA family protein [Algoriphagus sp.]